MKQMLKWGVTRRTATTVRRAMNPYGRASRSGAKGARYAPVQVFPRMPGQSVQRMNNKSTNSMTFDAEDRFADFTPQGGALNAPAGTILYDQLFNPGNFPNCVRLQTLAKLYARYCVFMMEMIVITKGTTSIQGGWVAYWDAELADDPAELGVNGAQLLTVATNHVGATEGNWWGGRFVVRAPRKADTLYVDLESAEQYWVYSHRFVMLSTGTSGMTSATNYATLLFRAKILFTEPTIEPLFVPGPSPSASLALSAGSSTGGTATAPLNISAMTTTGTGAVQLFVSPTNANNIPPNVVVIALNGVQQALQVPIGSYFVQFFVNGTGITTCTASQSGSPPFIVNAPAQSVVTATQAMAYIGVTTNYGATTANQVYLYAAITATTIGICYYRVFATVATFSRPRHLRSKDKATRQIEYLVDRRIRELRQEGQPVPVIEEIDDDEKSGIVVASSDVKSEIPRKPVSVVNGPSVYCKHCLEDPDFRVHMHDDFGQPRLIRDNRPLFLTSVHQD